MLVPTPIFVEKGETREIHVEIQINEKAEIKRIFCGEGN